MYFDDFSVYVECLKNDEKGKKLSLIKHPYDFGRLRPGYRNLLVNVDRTEIGTFEMSEVPNPVRPKPFYLSVFLLGFVRRDELHKYFTYF